MRNKQKQAKCISYKFGVKYFLQQSVENSLNNKGIGGNNFDYWKLSIIDSFFIEI